MKQLKTFRPTSPGIRHQVCIKKFLLSKKGRLNKSLLFGKNKQSGRSISTGHISVWHRGGGAKSLFRDIRISSRESFCIQLGVFYDPKRTAFVSLNYNFLSSKFFYAIHTNNTYPGSFVFSYLTYPKLKLGAVLRLKDVPLGSLVHNISLEKSKYIKAAGVFGILLQKDYKTCKIKLPSGKIKRFSVNSSCTLGVISNHENNLRVTGKAGRSRLKNKRPHVRGVAMNPIDHPHGGQTSGGCPSVTPWGIPTKGKPTRKKNVEI